MQRETAGSAGTSFEPPDGWDDEARSGVISDWSQPEAGPASVDPSPRKLPYRIEVVIIYLRVFGYKVSAAYE